MKKITKKHNQVVKKLSLKSLKKVPSYLNRKNRQYWQNFLTDFRYLCVLSFTIVGALCLKSGNIGILSVISLVPLCFYLQFSQKRSKKQFMTDFYVGGLILCFFSYYFLSQAAVKTWEVGVSGIASILAPMLALIYLSLFSALSSMIVGIIYFRINFRYRIIALVLIWPIMEFLRSLLFSLANIGHGYSLIPAFNFGALAIDASGTPLIYLSRYVGFYGLSTAVVIINVCVYFLVFKKGINNKIIASFILLFLVVINIRAWKTGIAYGRYKVISVAAVHLNNSDWIDSFGDIPTLSKNTDIIVLPEYAYYQSSGRISNITTKLSPTGVMIMSEAEYINKHKINNLTIYNKSGQQISKQAKSFLIPGGEYLPLFMKLFLQITSKQSLNSFNTLQALLKSKIPEKTVILDNDIRLGGLACSGVTRFDMYEALSKQGANLLTNSAQVIFLPNNGSYFASAKNMARYQAVANNKPFIQSSRGGESFIIDNQGRFIAESVGQQTQIISTKIAIKL